MLVASPGGSRACIKRLIYAANVSYDEIDLPWAILFRSVDANKHISHRMSSLRDWRRESKPPNFRKTAARRAPSPENSTLDCHARRHSLLIIWSHPSARAALHAVGNQPSSKTTGRMADQPAAADRRGEPPL